MAHISFYHDLCDDFVKSNYKSFTIEGKQLGCSVECSNFYALFIVVIFYISVKCPQQSR